MTDSPCARWAYLAAVVRRELPGAGEYSSITPDESSVSRRPYKSQDGYEECTCSEACQQGERPSGDHGRETKQRCCSASSGGKSESPEDIASAISPLPCVPAGSRRRTTRPMQKTVGEARVHQSPDGAAPATSAARPSSNAWRVWGDRSSSSRTMRRAVASSLSAAAHQNSVSGLLRVQRSGSRSTAIAGVSKRSSMRCASSCSYAVQRTSCTVHPVPTRSATPPKAPQLQTRVSTKPRSRPADRPDG